MPYPEWTLEEWESFPESPGRGYSANRPLELWTRGPDIECASEGHAVVNWGAKPIEIWTDCRPKPASDSPSGEA
jgi:hypothetical protein